MPTIRHILCPIDFSEFSRHALDQALAIAHHHRARVTVAHIVPPITPLLPMGEAPMYPPVIYDKDDLAELRLALERFAAQEGDIDVDTRVIEGNAVAEIVALADALRVDLLVMGTHGRSGFQRLLLGSVTERVLLKARCPVLTVPRVPPTRCRRRRSCTRASSAPLISLRLRARGSTMPPHSQRRSGRG